MFPKKRNKLLIVGAFPSPNSTVFGGVVTVCKIMIDSSFSDNYDLILIDSTQISNPGPSLAIRSLLAFKRLFKYSGHLFTARPDAVLLFTSLGFSVLEKGVMAWIAKMLSTPAILFPQGGELIDNFNSSFFNRAWIRAAMCGATHLMCQGSSWQRFATDSLGFAPSNAPIVPNWSATTSLLDLGAARVLTANAQNPVILYLGWVEKDKGIFELLEASRKLSRKYQFKLFIAGRGHAEEEARAFVAANSLQDKVELVGWVEGLDKESLLEAADILVLPSWAEGFPNAIIEAMAAKVAVVVTSVGNVPDLITDRKEALLIPPKDSCALERSIELLFTDINLRHGIAKRGHVFACENFAVEKGIKKLTLAIDQAIGLKGNK